MKQLCRWHSFSVLVLTAAGGIAGADEGAAAQKPDGACVACHGPGGDRPVLPDTPRLAGQEYDYLVHALQQYRGGARQNPIMGAMAKSLSDRQIADLARYFSKQPGLTTKY